MDRQARAHERPWIAVLDTQRAAREADTLAHPSEPEAVLDRIEVEPAPVVLYLDHKVPV
jgi:hypothetical protein